MNSRRDSRSSLSWSRCLSGISIIQYFLDKCVDLLIGLLVESCDRNTFSIENKPSMKVPAHIAGIDALEVLPNRMCVGTVNFDLLKERERNLERADCKILDVFGVAWLLSAELVARKPQTSEVARLILLLFVNHELVTALGVAALAGHVADERNLASERREVERFAVKVVNRKIIERAHLWFPLRGSIILAFAQSKLSHAFDCVEETGHLC